MNAAIKNTPPARAGVLATVGKTPAIKLEKMFPGIEAYAKLEMLNPGGSAKDRPALSMIDCAFKNGSIDRDSLIVESSSGNMAIGLAQICAYYGLKFVCVVDPRTTATNINIIKAYGASIEMVEDPDPETGEYLDARIQRVKDIIAANPNSFWPNQYENRANSLAHRFTMESLASQAGGELDYVFAAVSTCGTLRGCREYIEV